MALCRHRQKDVGQTARQSKHRDTILKSKEVNQHKFRESRSESTDCVAQVKITTVDFKYGKILNFNVVKQKSKYKLIHNFEIHKTSAGPADPVRTRPTVS